MRRSVTLSPDGQLLPVVWEAHLLEWNTRIAVHQVYEVCAPMGDAQLLQQKVIHGQEHCRASRFRSAKGLLFVTSPVGICGIQLGFDGCHLRVYAAPKAVIVAVLLRATRIFSSQQRNSFSLLTLGFFDMIPICEANLCLMAESGPPKKIFLKLP